MSFEGTITPQERTYLRDLAQRYRDYAQLPVMQERTRLWTAHNAARSTRPLIVVEYGTFAGDWLPRPRCQNPAAVDLELRLLGPITNHELIDDDKVIAPWLDLEWDIWHRAFDVEIATQHATDSAGRTLGYAQEHPLHDLAADFETLRPSTFGVDRTRTAARRQWTEDVLGDILPVKITNNSLSWFVTPSEKVIRLMGMEHFMYALLDYPDHVRRLYEFLRDDILRFVRWQEQEGLLTLNNANHYAGAGSYGFTDELPRTPAAGEGRITSGDLWVNMNSQETVSISPEMYEEFIFPCYRDLAREFGLVYYGCCEPVHTIWSRCLSQLENLRKVSISPWCDEEAMGERLRGTRVVYSRKPVPALLGVGAFDAEAWRAHIAHTLRAARGCALEIIVRDVYTLNGDRTRAGRAVKIARELLAGF